MIFQKTVRCFLVVEQDDKPTFYMDCASFWDRERLENIGLGWI